MASPTAKPGRYPRQLVIMVSTETGETVDRDALNREVSMSEVTRTYLELGIALGAVADQYDLEPKALLEAATLAAIRAARS